MLILNRDFKMPDDGWCQLAPLGEFPHAAAGIVQVIDREACEAMAARFGEQAGVAPFDKLRAESFPGVLIDFDHFSLDAGQRSEAAGWIVALEARGGGAAAEGMAHGAETGKEARTDTDGHGLFAKIRWSDVG